MGAPCIQYDDVVTIGFEGVGAYGDNSQIVEQAEVPAAIDMNTGYSHNANQTAIESDAVAFVDPANEFISDNFYRLEEALVKISLFGTPDKMAWYKVTDVTVSRDTQLCNEIDNIELSLKKTAQPLEVTS